MSFVLSAKRPLIMGILNVTPDSFSGDGLMMHKDYIAAAVDLGLQMIADGADILDIGGESSKPGAVPVDAAEELRRVLPVVVALRKLAEATPLAVDTVKAIVAEETLAAGAAIINDITALAGDTNMARVVAAHKAHVVLMHNRSQSNAVTNDNKIGGEYHAPAYGDIIGDVSRDLLKHVDAALKSGIGKDKIMLDPGIGFGKSVEQNLALINHIDRFKTLGFPIVIGTSRKSFIGRVLDGDVGDRLEGTAATVAVAALRGADIVRVHDVKFMARVARMAGAIAAQ